MCVYVPYNLWNIHVIYNVTSIPYICNVTCIYTHTNVLRIHIYIVYIHEYTFYIYICRCVYVFHICGMHVTYTPIDCILIKYTSKTYSIYMQCNMNVTSIPHIWNVTCMYEVAAVSRIDEIIGLSCKRAL